MTRLQRLVPLVLLALTLAACGGAGGSSGPTYTLALPSGTFDASKIEVCDLLSENEFSGAVNATVQKQLPATLNDKGTARICVFKGQTVTGVDGKPVTNGGFVGVTVQPQTLDQFNAVYGQPLLPGCVVNPVILSQFQTSAQGAFTQLCPQAATTGDIGVWVNGLTLLVEVSSGTGTSTTLLPAAQNLAILALQQALTNAGLSPTP
ncbi:MAG: hypothetical protein ACXVAE_01445 [Candidatus Limnocylindrales bacterium]